MLMILAEADVNMPALRMAANLVGPADRAGGRARGGGAAAAVRAPASVPAEPARPSRRVAEAPPGMRRFRGRDVD